MDYDAKGNRRGNTAWATLAWAVALGSAAGSAHGGTAVATGALTVRVEAVKIARGFVNVDICTERQFLKTCPITTRVPAQAGATAIVIHGLPPGRYAAQVYHDKNGNGKVDRKLFGIPTEGVGFSNDAPINFAPPKFADAAFDFVGGDATISLSLRYF